MTQLEKVLVSLGELGFFAGRMFRSLFSGWPDLSLVILHMYKIGVETLPVLIAVCIFVGTNIALVGFHIFKSFGGQEFLGAYVGLSCVRELAPILTGAMMAAKPGTDISATIATMRVKEQIDALEVMSVDPFQFLIVPRLIAFIFAAPLLVLFGSFFSVAAGYLVAVFQLHQNSGQFINDVKNYVLLSDIFNGMLKGSLFAVVGCLLSCFFGFYSQPGPKGVSRAINLSVVTIASFIVIFNFFLTAAIYG
ncbi:ABC transporter permease [bacterium (Candidatus Blackallbacteria) CG17_big_fil_post_rev_8_21_14_2_50_48_46]|uniref:ABC transporter permease n=1 Tax=bacterium (Candidatus Blackallbacteria) CG17_big_fil_post_rev_8_21_14_2_50_48_46 TaxID=2014261 RepID=A0A2M7G0K1_9BACT|nr:MAG: ABC transporter permease [bacterium (Candidatus Blackallbacteria) CG18_big_fil_WC_8_21_14_2_50_49_26]PIW15199.1 MAG: ABC transporter permease [bacterium (Candidatus Blackallbacteria) CG17_big_fil_post_rev_8_21_14_2_50_48_46]PIW44786.1 MAG: ABC transporter permease [bacterium (Candidatus Blackallbacteria) CG13_big_fil_rev_8_21_14_2_50_49_14]